MQSRRDTPTDSGSSSTQIVMGFRSGIPRRRTRRKGLNLFIPRLAEELKEEEEPEDEDRVP